MGENEKKVDNNSVALSDNKNLNKKIKLYSILFFVVAIAWIFVINPYVTFKKNEKTFSDAARRYFETYSQELPTGERIGDVTLQELYDKGLVTTDFYVPYNLLSKRTCSVTDSWVKVKRVEDDYKYYTYLKCGVLSSTIDHKGPKITLNDKKEMTISLGEKFKDPGIKKIRDFSDGDIDIDKATVKGEVDTNNVGTYKLTYIAYDSLKNKSEVTRTVTVVQKLNSTVKSETENKGYYSGANPNNYIYFSGMLFRIVDLDGDNVRIIADRDISNVNYDGIDKWLDYYYDHIQDDSKKLVVKNKYCQMDVSSANLGTTTCEKYTGKREVYIPSIVDVNKAAAADGNYLRPLTMSWVADSKNKNTGYVTRNHFYNDYLDATFFDIDKKYNFGVRPILTIKGDILVTSGKGSEASPYEIGDFKRAKASDKVSTRQSGEYLDIDGRKWQIVDTEDDGTTKVIALFTLVKNSQYLDISYDLGLKTHTYNPTKSGNVGYQINNLSSKYIETDKFVKHEIEVPIYKNDAKYGEETKVSKYKTKIFAPNMYEMFSTFTGDDAMKSYWTINSSQNKYLKYGVSDIGAVLYGEVSEATEFGIRPTAYLSKDCIIVSGNGTANNPYKIDK